MYYLNDYVTTINNYIRAINNYMHSIKINDDNTVIFENLPNINNISLDVNYFNYFNEVISKNCDIHLYKINSSFNYNLKYIVLKLKSPIIKNKIINNARLK